MLIAKGNDFNPKYALANLLRSSNTYFGFTCMIYQKMRPLMKSHLFVLYIIRIENISLFIALQI